MIIMPKSGTGAKTALRAPTTTRASFEIMRRHSLSFWLGVKPEGVGMDKVGRWWVCMEMDDLMAVMAR